jgi:hypothetical protein
VVIEEAFEPSTFVHFAFPEGRNELFLVSSVSHHFLVFLIFLCYFS